MPKKLNPKCIHGKDLSFYHTGHVLPCCWLNNHKNDIKCRDLFSEEMHIDNFDTVEEIFETETWKQFFEMLRKNPKDAPQQCWKMCTTPLHVDPEINEEKRINFKK